MSYGTKGGRSGWTCATTLLVMSEAHHYLCYAAKMEPPQGHAPCSQPYQGRAALSLLRRRKWRTWRVSRPLGLLGRQVRICKRFTSKVETCRGVAPRATVLQTGPFAGSVAGQGGIHPIAKQLLISYTIRVMNAHSDLDHTQPYNLRRGDFVDKNDETPLMRLEGRELLHQISRYLMPSAENDSSTTRLTDEQKLG